MAITQKKRIWGWMTFDWATQPFYTLGLTFIFGPFFAEIASQYFLGTGLSAGDANAKAQSTWAFGQTVAGLFIAFSAPFLGAYADAAGRKIPWIALFSLLYIAATWSLWYIDLNGTNLTIMLVIFYIGFIAAESALNFINAILPSLGDEKEIGRISGSGAAFGYWGGVLSLAVMLALFAESATTGTTMIGLSPVLGLDADAREGTRAVGPFMAIWYAVFIIPFFLYVRDDPALASPVPKLRAVWQDLKTTLIGVSKRPSLASFLIGGMFYRDALNALYGFGGVYCGVVIGGAGGALYAASRSLMVRHSRPETATQTFGLFALSGKATAFLAPFLIGVFTAISGNVQIGFVPVIILFLLGLIMLRWVNKNGDSAQ